MRKTKRNYNRNVEKDHDFFFSVSDTGGIIHLHNIDTGPYRIVAKV